MTFSDIYDLKIYRKILNVYEDDNFIIDLSWIDDEIGMLDLPEFSAKTVIDRPIKAYKSHITEIPKIIEVSPESQSERKPGRPLNPKTDHLPMPKKRGRPNISSLAQRNFLFGKSQTSTKRMISNEDIKHYRLVILTSLKPTGHNIKYTLKEVATFYLQKQDLDIMKNLSWHLISMSEIGYFNSDLKLTNKYVLPSHFIAIDYFPKNIKRKKELAFRKARLAKAITPYKNYYYDFLKFVEVGTEKGLADKEAIIEFVKMYFHEGKNGLQYGEITEKREKDYYDDLVAVTGVHREDVAQFYVKEKEEHMKFINRKEMEEEEISKVKKLERKDKREIKRAERLTENIMIETAKVARVVIPTKEDVLKDVADFFNKRAQIGLTQNPQNRKRGF